MKEDKRSNPMLSLVIAMTISLLLSCSSKNTNQERLDKMMATSMQTQKNSVENIEAAQIEARIANDLSKPSKERRKAILNIFEKHVPPGTQLFALQDMLNHPTWIRDSKIILVGGLAGDIPITWKSGDTHFAIDVLPGSDDCDAAIYLRIRGIVDFTKFKDLLAGDSGTGIDLAVIEELGFYEKGIGMSQHPVAK